MTVCKVETALNFSEKKKLQKFLTVHEKICPDIRKSCAYSISFSNISGIGISTYVTCSVCKTKHNITDYGAW